MIVPILIILLLSPLVTAYTPAPHVCSGNVLNCGSVSGSTGADASQCGSNSTIKGQIYYFNISSCQGDSFSWCLQDPKFQCLLNGVGPVDTSYTITQSETGTSQMMLFISCSNPGAVCQITSNMSYSGASELFVSKLMWLIVGGAMLMINMMK